MLSNFFFDDIEDEIFGHQMSRMRQMTNQMLADPFGGGGFGGFGMFGMGMPGLMNIGGVGSLMPRMQMMNHNNGFSQMNRLLAAPTNPGMSYSSSSVFCMSSNGNGQPQIYKETSSMRAGPNGVRETRRTVEDSATGTKKMAIGHHIGERARVVEKEQNIRTGEREENEELINLDEDEAEDFERDFHQKVNQPTHHYLNPRRHQLQIEEISSEPLPAIASAEDYHRSRHQNTTTSAPSARRSIRSSPLALPPSTSSRSNQDPSLLHPHPYNSPSRKQTKSSRKIKGHLHHH